MEFLNRVQIGGVVRLARLTNCDPTTICNCSLRTKYAYKGDNGCATIDTLWIQVIACGTKPGWPDLEKIQKGSKVHVIGRLRAKRYCDAEGVDRVCYEVVAQNLEVVDD